MTVLATENFLLAQIRTWLGTSVRGVQTLPGDWDDEMLKRFLRSVPGVFLVFAGGGLSAAAGSLEARIDARWIVYVATGHPTEEARRRGNAQQVGAYALLQVLLPQLHGLMVPDVGSTYLVDVQNLYSGQVDRQALTVYAITLGLPMCFDLVAPDAVLAPFTTFVAQYDIPPMTPEQHADWIDEVYTAGTPDARDDVALPQT